MIVKITSRIQSAKSIGQEQKESILFVKGEFAKLLEKKLKMPVTAYRL